MSTESVRVYEPLKFGSDFELDLRAYELRRYGKPLKLERIPMELLVLLVERRGELVTRDQIVEHIWGKDVFLDTDNSINAAVRKIRQVLKDDPDRPRFLVTVTGKGYRFVAAVEEISPPAIAPSPVSPEPKPPADYLGRKISHYRVIQMLGGGGMGVVYKAEDLKLGRPVALKFLPTELASDPVAFERLQREARAASVLDHPNICSIYQLGEHEGQPFIVMQYLEGHTLREWIESEASKTATERVQGLTQVAIQIADGLNAAHQKGVIHRDIKPTNIFITSRGQAKILDFGVAKFVNAAEGGEAKNPATSPSINPGVAAINPHLTRTGASVGTPSYLSPEQVRREKIDTRTDLFSFGLVLYEMATGHRAFSGNTASEIREAVLNLPLVPAREVNPQLPPKLESIITKAVEKDRDLRYQSAIEIRDDLESLGKSLDLPATEIAAVERRASGILGIWTKPILVIALLLLIPMLGLLFHWFTPRVTQAPTPMTERQLTHNPPENRTFGSAISPDGKLLAFSDTRGLHLASMESGDTHDIGLPTGFGALAWEVSWFPDVQQLLLTSVSETGQTDIWRVSIFGDAPHKLWSDSYSPSVSPTSGSIAYITAGGHELWVAGWNGENPKILQERKDETYDCVTWSPTGDRIAYWAGTEHAGEIESIPTNGGPAQRVISDSGLALPDPRVSMLLWLPDSRLYFSRTDPETGSGILTTVHVDPSTGVASGLPQPIPNWHDGGPSWPSATRDGKQLVVVKIRDWDDIFSGDLNGRNSLTLPDRPLSVTRSHDLLTGWAHDGRTLYFQSDRIGRNQIYRQNFGEEVPERIAPANEQQEGAELTPDGKWLLFWSMKSSKEAPRLVKQLVRIPASGGPPVRLIETDPSQEPDFHCPHASGAPCILARTEDGHRIFYRLDPVQSLGPRVATISDLGEGRPHWSVSPDGSRIAVTELGKLRIFDLRDSTERIVIPRMPGTTVSQANWAADGKSLFAEGWNGRNSFVVQMELNGATHPLIKIGKDHIILSPLPSPDGRHLAFSQHTWESNVWLLENF